MGNPFSSIRLRSETAGDTAAGIEAAIGVLPASARVLAARGFSPGPELEHFIKPAFRREIDDPKYILGMPEAAKLLNTALSEKKKIAIACDYDVDGLSGGVQLYLLLQQLGADAKVYVPDRFIDGYGLSRRLVDAAIGDGAELLVCIDFGTTNEKELRSAKDAGMATIVLDHHEVSEVPASCDVYVNPKQSGCGFQEGTLCAAGLVWGLISTLRQERGDRSEFDTADFLPFASLASVCDMVPLKSWNRVIAKLGMRALATTKNLGLRTLLEESGIRGEISAYMLGFVLGPQINAAGRMRNGSLVVELFTSNNPDITSVLAKRLGELNRERQETEEQVKKLAIQAIEASDRLPAALIVQSDDAHIGVVGIVAQRLVEAYYRPSIVLGKEGAMLKGSVRGLPGLNVVEALRACEQHLEKYGGHEAAGGLALRPEKFEPFRKAFEDYCSSVLSEEDLVPTVKADTTMTLAEFDDRQLEELKIFEPFGMGNPTPQFLFQQLEVLEVTSLKARHLKLFLKDEQGKHVTALWWRCKEHPEVYPGNTIDLVARLDSSEYRGERERTLNVQAVQRCAS